MSPSASPPRVAIAGILHESNTFSPVKTSLADFERTALRRGHAIFEEWADSQHEIGGFIAGARQFGFEMVPTLGATATPSGPVTAEALDTLASELTDRLRSAGKIDGLLLALHGAMVSEQHPDGDAEVLRRVRRALGNDLPIVLTHDFHANIGEDVVRHSTALVVYKENPHIDQRERGIHAARILNGILRGGLQPVQALAKPPMIYNIRFQHTRGEPLRPIVEETRRLEQNPAILAASVSGGYQYADVEAMGPSVVLVTNGDPDLANREATRLAALLWDARDKLQLNLPNAAEAVQQAISSDRTPVVLVEMGDNIGGGSAGDSTFILAELMRQQAVGWVVAIRDLQAVQQAFSAGVGGEFSTSVGGKTDQLHGDPVAVRGQVKLLFDGQYVETEIRHGGARYHDMGPSAVVHVTGSTGDVPNILLLTTHREMPFSLGQLTSCGIVPQHQKILVVKGAIAYRAAYEPIAGRIIEVDTPGLTAVNPAHFTYTQVRRPLFGIEP
jgi:microcystin degradation protein MlrC